MTSTDTRLPFRAPTWTDPEPAKWLTEEAPAWDGAAGERKAEGGRRNGESGRRKAEPAN